VSLSDATAPAGMLVLDAELRIVAVHAAAPIGRVAGEHAGELLAHVDADVFGAIAAAAERVARTGRPEVGLGVAASTGLHAVSIFPAAGGSRDITCVYGAPAANGGAGAIVAATADAIVTTDADGIICSWNPGAERLYGYPAAEAVGSPISMLDPPDRRPRSRELMRKVGSGERRRRREVVRVRADGVRVTVSLTVTPLCDAAGRPAGTAEIGRDVSGRIRDERRTERALRESERRRREVVASMLQAEEVERSRIATALHDDTVQVMIASLMAMDRVALVAQKNGSAHLASAVAVARATLEEATDRTRRLMFELRPSVLLREGLVAAVHILADQVGRETGAVARVRGSVGRYDHTVEELVYRSVQEALANVRKHAHPSTITVSIVEHAGSLLSEVCDDGLGFDVVDARTRPQSALHLGLDALHERIGAVGGTVEIISSPGEGTCVRFAVPLADFSSPVRAAAGLAATYGHEHRTSV
jgi:PAS domain S-box-containing protein